MLVLLIILGILAYILSCILVVVLTVVRMTLDRKEYGDTFKENLLDILDDHVSTDDQFVLALCCMFSPLGILAQIVMIIIDFIDRTLIDRIRDWCKK